MLADLFNMPLEIEIDGKKYKAEYDFKSYATLETLTGKGFYKLYDLLMVQNNLTLNDSLELVCCALVKHHNAEEVAEVRKFLTENLHLIKELNSQIISAFILPILPPEIVETVEKIKKKTIEQLTKK